MGEMVNEDGQDRVAAWRFFTLTQLGAAINVILGLSVIALGFEMALVMNQEIDPGDALQRFSLISSLSSVLMLLLSVVTGVLVVVTRQRDSRAVLLAAEAEQISADTQRANRRYALSGKLRIRSWRLFWFQAGSFAFGILLAIIGVTLAVIASVLAYGEMPAGCDI